MFTAQEFAALKARIRAAVDTNDVATIASLIGVKPTEIEANRDKITMVMHKHRLEMRDKTRTDRQASFDWLKQRGHTDVFGIPLPARLSDLDGNR